MKLKILIMIAAAGFMLIESSCKTTVEAGKPTPHKHHWGHRHTQKEVIIIK